MLPAYAARRHRSLLHQGRLRVNLSELPLPKRMEVAKLMLTKAEFGVVSTDVANASCKEGYEAWKAMFEPGTCFWPCNAGKPTLMLPGSMARVLVAFVMNAHACRLLPLLAHVFAHHAADGGP